MQFNIRGGMGVQITSIIAAHAIAYESGRIPTIFVLNKGMYKKFMGELYPELNMNCNYFRYFEKVIEFKNNIEIKEIEGTEKTNGYNKDNAKLICKHIGRIREEIKIKTQDIPQTKNICVLKN